MSLLLAVLILGVIILIHEFGHFLLAKLCGIGVLEFSLGMGPRLLSFQKGETRYSIKLLPFGGSCMMLGEDEDASDPRAFNNKPVFSRILVVAAGQPDMVTKEYLKPGQVIIDVGINVDAEGKLCGDVDFAQAEPVAAAITPVPGGVGTVTTSVLVGHVVEAAARQTGK